LPRLNGSLLSWVMSTIRENFPALPLGEQPVVEWMSAAPVVADTFAGRVHVEWDNTAPVTPFGQLPFFIEYLKLVLLRHKLVRARRVVERPQHGQRGKRLMIAATSLRRMVAIEFGMCRSGRKGGSVGYGKSREPRGGTRS
jgi:hypothetical protein